LRDKKCKIKVGDSKWPSRQTFFFLKKNSSGFLAIDIPVFKIYEGGRFLAPVILNCSRLYYDDALLYVSHQNGNAGCYPKIIIRSE